MGKQTIKQQARRAALGVQARLRAERAAREKRLGDLAVQVLTAVGERDAAVASAERRAGAALADMTEVEGLTLRQAVDWCGEQINVREAARLRRLVEETESESGEAGDGAGSGAATATTPGGESERGGLVDAGTATR